MKNKIIYANADFEKELQSLREENKLLKESVVNWHNNWIEEAAENVNLTKKLEQLKAERASLRKLLADELRTIRKCPSFFMKHLRRISAQLQKSRRGR